MQITLNRLDPNVPDPVESRRRAAGRALRIAYATVVFGILAFVVAYFAAPLVYLRGPGTVSAPRHVVSLPMIVQVIQMKLAPGAAVKAGDEIAQVVSPEQDNIVASFSRALADVAGRTAELRVKSRVAQDTLDAARSYLRVAEEAAERVDGMSAATVTFRMEVLRERAPARKAVVSQEAEVSESAIQLLFLDEFIGQLRAHLQEVERRFGHGRVQAPVAGIVSTGLAHAGQSLVAGTPIAEILDPTDIFVDWYIPNERLIDPKVGNEVFVLFGNRRIPGTIAEILPVSGVFAGTRQLMTRERAATQIARIRLDKNASPPALETTVYVHMHYTNLTVRFMDWLVRLLGWY
ncbi:MAG TPA: HlyD family efflux transporter periplasmic adaptor subunit [Xanthobacteraceae bacterium]|nr:HlyD family efflux transporter periplasmic adaptor subunit [Xanthobacteraceae bacterium]